MKKKLYLFLVFIIFIAIFFFPSWCGDGVKLGINILLYSLLPAILPFMLFSNVMIQSNLSKTAGCLVHPLFHKLFKTSANGSYALLMGFLCGYPLGAKIINDLLFEKKISHEEGVYLYKFINNPSPAFIQGYVMTSVCAPKQFRIPALILTYFPAILTGFVLCRKQTAFPDITNNTNETSFPLSKIIDDSIFDACATTIRLGGYLIIFCIFSTLITHISGLSAPLKCTITCMLEITSGIYYISKTTLPAILKLFFSILCSIGGGFSILFQINSVSAKSGLSIFDCIKYKLICMLICTILFFLYIGIVGI